MSHETKIDKSILRQYMFSLYTEPETIYREYIQNACDSITEAINVGYLEKNEARIHIQIDSYKNEITIEDNGMGILASKAESIFKDIAYSTKRGQDFTAGYYGIGRYVGGGYCKFLKFETTYKNEDTISEIIFDMDKIECHLNDLEELEPTKIIDKDTDFKQYKDEKIINKHYFKVTLQGIKKEYKSCLLDKEKIQDYLTQIAPIPYDLPFLNNLFKPSLVKLKNSNKELYDKISSYYEKLNKIEISLNDCISLRKKYGLNIEGTNEIIDSLNFFIISDTEYKDLAWGWYPICDHYDAIKGQNLTQEIRLRQHNIQIGGSNYFDGDDYYSEKRFGKYYIGEIHVIHNNIKPISARYDLDTSPESRKLKEKMKDFFKDSLSKLIRETSNVKSADKKINEAQKILVSIENRKISDDYSQQQKDIDINAAKQDIINAVKNKDKAIDKIKNEKVKATINKTKRSEKIVEAPKDLKKITNEERLRPLERKFNQNEIKMIGKIFAVLDLKLMRQDNGNCSMLNSIKTEIISSLLK